MGLLGLSFASPPSTFALPPSSIPLSSSSQQQPLYVRACENEKVRAPSLYTATAPRVREALPYKWRPLLVSRSPFPVFGDSPLCRGSSFSTRQQPFVSGNTFSIQGDGPLFSEALPYMRQQPLVWESPFPIRGNVPSCPETLSL